MQQKTEKWLSKILTGQTHWDMNGLTFLRCKIKLPEREVGLEKIDEMEKHIACLEKQTRKLEKQLRVVIDASRSSTQATEADIVELDKIITDHNEAKQSKRASKKCDTCREKCSFKS